MDCYYASFSQAGEGWSSRSDSKTVSRHLGRNAADGEYYGVWRAVRSILTGMRSIADGLTPNSAGLQR